MSDTTKEYDKLSVLVAQAIMLLIQHEPEEGYYLAFSGGKDSCVIKELANMAEVLFFPHYNNVTIDPPELVKFIKTFHSDVKWNQPRHGNMLHRVATAPKVPPTRSGRWCCEEYKECGGKGWGTKVVGVRAAESPRRKRDWKEVTEDVQGSKVICPILFWEDDDVWEFIRRFSIPYCTLYDEGWTRLGCIGCPLASKKNQDREFLRWPRYEQLWKRAVVANWEKWKDIPNSKTGEPRYHAKFKSGDEFWLWWRTERKPDVLRECQSGILWTNLDEEDSESKMRYFDCARCGVKYSYASSSATDWEHYCSKKCEKETVKAAT